MSFEFPSTKPISRREFLGKLADPKRTLLNELLGDLPGSPIVTAILDMDEIRLDLRGYSGEVWGEDGDATEAFDAYMEKVRGAIESVFPSIEDATIIFRTR